MLILKYSLQRSLHNIENIYNIFKVTTYARRTFCQFYKADFLPFFTRENICDFLLDFLLIKPLLKGVYT